MEPETITFLGPASTVSVPLERYEQLIRYETERDALFHAYRTTPSYYMEYILDAIFNPTFKYKPESAEESARGQDVLPRT